MGKEPESLVRLVAALERLPGVGRRTAERLAHHLLRAGEDEASDLARAILDARARIRPCGTCLAPAETDPCPVCSDSRRDRGLVLVVETARDLHAVERSGTWKGVYHVLGGRLSPLEGVTADALSLDVLAARARSGTVREVVIATNPDLEGDGTGLAVARALEGIPGVVVSRLARGMPSGGAIEHASKAVLSEALENRTPAR